MPRYSTHQRIQWFPKRTKKTPGRVESLLKTGLIFQLSCSTLHFQVDLTISDRYSPPKSHPFFEKEKKSSKNLHFWGFLSWKFIISGVFFGIPTCFYPGVFFLQKMPSASPPQSSPRADVRCPTGHDSKRAKQMPTNLGSSTFFTYENSEAFFFRWKKDSLPKNSGGKISGVMGLFPKSSPKTMKKRRVRPDWFFWCQYLQVMLGRFSFRVTVTTGTVAGQLTSQDWSDPTS